MQTFHHCLESYTKEHPDVYGTLNVDFSTEGQINPPAMELKDYSTLNQLQLLHKSPIVCQRTNSISLIVNFFVLMFICQGKNKSRFHKFLFISMHIHYSKLYFIYYAIGMSYQVKIGSIAIVILLTALIIAVGSSTKVKASSKCFY